MSKPIKVAMIYGSVRNGRLCDAVAGWVAARVGARDDYTLDIIDPLAEGLTDLRGTDGAEEAAIAARLNQADAFIVVTPEYNHSFPAALKHFIDGFNEPWHAKPVAFVSYGGLSGGSRAVEQLRQVFAELHATTIRQVVSFPNVWAHFDEQRRWRDMERGDRNLNVLLTQLRWWAAALRDARAGTDYQAVS
ncbi:MAG: FMN reductase [Alcanivorax sp.]|nr:FMN reductase [Alcanivorax sp.]